MASIAKPSFNDPVGFFNTLRWTALLSGELTSDIAASGGVKDSKDVITRMRRISKRTKNTKSEIVAIGISTGGPNALAQMMPLLPADLGAPVLIVQHMPPIFTESLAKSLSSKCPLSVREAKDGEVLSPNTAFIAPGGKHMKVVASADGKNRIIRITDDPPENS